MFKNIKVLFQHAVIKELSGYIQVYIYEQLIDAMLYRDRHNLKMRLISDNMNDKYFIVPGAHFSIFRIGNAITMKCYEGMIIFFSPKYPYKYIFESSQLNCGDDILSFIIYYITTRFRKVSSLKENIDTRIVVISKSKEITRRRGPQFFAMTLRKRLRDFPNR